MLFSNPFLLIIFSCLTVLKAADRSAWFFDCKCCLACADAGIQFLLSFGLLTGIIGFFSATIGLFNELSVVGGVFVNALLSTGMLAICESTALGVDVELVVS